MVEEPPYMAAIARAVSVQAEHEQQLRAAESRRVDGRFLDVYGRMDAGFDRIDSLITATASRADITAIKMEEGVKQLAATVTATTETTRLAAAAAVAATTKAFDERLKPVEEAMRVAAGRNTVANPLLMAVVGAMLTMAGGLLVRALY